MEPLVSPATSPLAATSSSDAERSADLWQRRFGVPWEHVDRAARAVLDRAAAASKRQFADLNNSGDVSLGTNLE